MNKKMSKLMSTSVILTGLLWIATLVVLGFAIRNLLSAALTLFALAE